MTFVLLYGKSVATAIGVLHVHYRCLQLEMFNTRKTVVSHGYIAENDTDEQALSKLKEKYTGPDPCAAKTDRQMMFPFINSAHKVHALAQYLAGCDNFKPENVYGDMKHASQNPDFNHFLNATYPELRI